MTNIPAFVRSRERRGWGRGILRRGGRSTGNTRPRRLPGVRRVSSADGLRRLHASATHRSGHRHTMAVYGVRGPPSLRNVMARCFSATAWMKRNHLADIRDHLSLTLRHLHNRPRGIPTGPRSVRVLGDGSVSGVTACVTPRPRRRARSGGSCVRLGLSQRPMSGRAMHHHLPQHGGTGPPLGGGRRSVLPTRINTWRCAHCLGVTINSASSWTSTSIR